jgi:CubicO group peptidase (beta-lactamase class C family)
MRSKLRCLLPAFCFLGMLSCSSVQVAAPRDVDYSAVISELRSFIALEMDRLELPCLGIALVDGSRIVWEEGFGWQDAAAGIRATERTVFRIGSISKLFTATAVMQLQEEGLLDIRTPIVRYAPEAVFQNPFNPRSPITLRHLLTHTAGILRESAVGGYFDPSSPGIERTVRSFFGTELIYPVGRRTSYSNLGPTIAGYIIEKTVGIPVPEYVRRRILEPAGMTSSSFLADTDAVRKNLATAFMVGFGGRLFQAPVFDLGTIPAGNLSATAGDLARFMICLFRDGEGVSGRILSKETLRQMFRVQFPANAFNPNGFGIGYYVNRFAGRRAVSHDGAVYGFASAFTALPDEKLGVVVLNDVDCANGFNSKVVEKALRLMLNAKVAAGLPPLPQPADLNGRSLDEYAGKYTFSDREDRVSVEQGGLDLMHLGSPCLLRPLGGDRFIADGRMSYGGVYEFIRDSAGRVAGLKLHGSLRLYKKVPDYRPSEAVPGDLERFCGEYGWPYNIMKVYGQDGNLACLVEWFFEYPLERTGDSTFVLPGYSLYAGEKMEFIKDADGRITAVRLGDVLFPRL